MYIAMLGRQPSLGLAELERLYGADKLTPLSQVEAALLDVELEPSALQRLGGTIKLAKVLFELDTHDWRAIEKYLTKTTPDHLQYVPEGKMRLGLSVYGLRVSPDAINATGLRLKRLIKSAGRSVRVVPNNAPALNSAQVIHNQLTGATGWELLLVKHGNKTILAQTIAEQDIEAYAARDQARPARDAFVGMLPPKLAQIMINLANVDSSTKILDPFCGTGVVLQEALLMGHDVIGTDLSDKMVDYSTRNLKWLSEKFTVHAKWDVSLGDAMDTKWPRPIGAVVCEGYLGQPFSAPPSAEKLIQVRGNCDHIISEFLRNVGAQVEKGTPLCIAVPAWRQKDGSLAHLPLTGKLSALGYKVHTFEHVDRADLLYYRPDQVVARELLVLEKV
jgi:tRNA G10  N-methylase Trm11